MGRLVAVGGLTSSAPTSAEGSVVWEVGMTGASGRIWSPGGVTPGGVTPGGGMGCWQRFEEPEGCGASSGASLDADIQMEERLHSWLERWQASVDTWWLALLSVRPSLSDCVGGGSTGALTHPPYPSMSLTAPVPWRRLGSVRRGDGEAMMR